MSMLRRIYRKLPIIRELAAIEHRLTSINHNLATLDARFAQDQRTMQLREYEDRLLASERYTNQKNLSRYAFQVFSQFGEDGMIAEIFKRIGTESRTFLEIGVGDGLENNTVYLLQQGWDGYWFEGEVKNIQHIEKHFHDPISRGKLQLKQAFITAENIAQLIQQQDIPSEFDLLSLDIDRNTYWLWNALPELRPRVMVVEYNAQIPAEVDWKVEYVADKQWNNTSYFGASLKAYELLGRQFGYSLVGCTVSGVNAFFVRNDLCADKFEAPFTAEHHYEPPRFFLRRRIGHPPSYTDT
jgi:hypothetical protein